MNDSKSDGQCERQVPDVPRTPFPTDQLDLFMSFQNINTSLDFLKDTKCPQFLTQTLVFETFLTRNTN